MAEAIASFLIESVFSLIVEKAVSSYGVNDQVQSAREKLQDMYIFLRNAEPQLPAGDETVSDFLSKIREAVHDLEDVVATYLSSGSIERKVKAITVKSKLEEVVERLSKLQSDVFQLQSLETLRENERERSSREREQRETFGHGRELGIVGFEENISQVVAYLTETETRGRVVAVSGMGGIGKTTLAREVYHHGQVRRRFEYFGWAYVSRRFRGRREVWETLLIDLVSSPTEAQREEIARMKDGEMARRLYETLKRNRCLVVLDDIWTTETWQSLKAAFPLEDESSSKIILTTRNKRVALNADPNAFIHELGCLDDNKSWELLKDKANFDRLVETGEKTKLERLGREMVKHCAGLPLAIKLLGGVLSHKQRTYEWEDVHRRVKIAINEGDVESSGVAWVLSLSYHELPHELKPCFLYLAHFPVSLEIISVKDLCQMWIAEGLVLSKEDELEVVAYDRFLLLVERYMVQIGGWNSTGRIKTCRVHDLIRDFCLSKSRKENVLEIVDLRNKHRARDFVSSSAHDSQESPAKVRRLVVNLNNNVADELDPIIKREYNCLRSFICFNEIRYPYYNAKTLQLLFKRFPLLRILKFNNLTPSKFENLPKELGNLTHLRLLSMRKSNVQVLPSSIGKLRSLLNLDLRITSSVKLPTEITNLEKLRYLYLPPVYNVVGQRSWWNGQRLPNDQRLRLNELKSLRTLVNVHVSTNCCGLNDLVQLTRLEKLKIRVDTNQDLNVHQGSEFKYLRSLSIEASTLHEHPQHVDIEPFISICPHIRKLQLKLPLIKLPEDRSMRQLLKLTLSHTRLNYDQMSTLERLEELRILVIGTDAFTGTEMVCSAGGFRQLESLSLVELNQVSHWTVEEGAFPSLSHLHIEYCSRLSEVPNGLRYVRTLKKMVVRGMSLEFCWRVKRGEDFEKVQHVASREFSDY